MMRRVGWAVTIHLVLAAISSGAPQGLTPEDRFDRASKSIACEWRPGNTPEAAAELQKALDSGHANKAEAYRLISLAYDKLARFYVEQERAGQPVSAEKKEEALRQQNDAYRKLAEAAPNNPKALELFVGSLQDGSEEKKTAFQKLLAIDPKGPNVGFLSGLSLIREGRIQEGIATVQSSMALESDIFILAWRIGASMDLLNQRCTPQYMDYHLLRQVGFIHCLELFPGYGVAAESAKRVLKKNFMDTLGNYGCQKGHVLAR